MQEDLGKYIADLLYRHDRLNIPGLGSFELAHAPALVDQVQGQVTAPAKAVTFNENLVLDDGLLVAYLQQVNAWTPAQAQRWIKGEVERIKAALQNKEIVELPGVGRFFRNFEQQLKFVAESGNFNIDTYGLQPVRAQLISRSREEKIPVVQPRVAPPPRPRSARASAEEMLGSATAWLRGNLVLVAAAACFLLLLAAFLLYQPEPKPAAEDPIAELPQERLNASPSKTTPPPAETAPAPSPPVRELPPAPAEDATEDVDTEAPTLAPEEHTAVIAVGLFSNPDNAQRMMERLAKDGYSPVSKREGDMTRIGASIRFTEESELESDLRRIRRKYTDSAFILTRDGKSVR